MKNLWHDSEASQCDSPLELRAYTSRLLGQSADLVLHGGGNTSVKDVAVNVFGESEEILYIKGSGHDLETIGTDGFAPTRLKTLQKLSSLPTLSDTDMVRELKCSQTDPKAPAPSVETILHAIIPHKYVDHTHADAVVSISNTQGGEDKIRGLYGDEVLILPYVMPGFILAKQVFDATRTIDWDVCRGIILLHHGVFTFHDDARQSYENMLHIVTKAEQYIAEHIDIDVKPGNGSDPSGISALEFARLRKQVGARRGGNMVARFLPLALASLDNVEDCARRGPLTPDHVLHTKQLPMLMTGDDAADIDHFAAEYQSYFDRHAGEDLTCLDLAPRWGVRKDKGAAAFAINGKRLKVCTDIVEHTAKAILWGEQMDGWQALPEQDIFDVEYWELEQAKLKKTGAASSLEGKVALVTGAASGIGRAAVAQLMNHGVCVVGLDKDPTVTEVSNSPLYLGSVTDVTQTDAIRKALETTVLWFGGIDIVVSNAGSFPTGAYLQDTSDEQWHAALALNLDSHFKVIREVIPYLKEGFDASVIVVASKNVLAPGPGAGAYSVAKAALTQLARVAALELADHGIRVNVLHPDAVFDTGIWTDDVLNARAEKYGLTVDEYKRRNLLATEISSDDVARAILAMADKDFAKSTGMQLTIDGGNERTL